ncbi:MAG: hypothetical protein R6U32_07835 [Candidatus Woesearchaeota archaeon]
MQKRCPICGSGNIRTRKYRGAECIVCSNCGYDQCSEYDTASEGRKSQKHKGRYTPYKTGGSSRAGSLQKRMKEQKGGEKDA